MAPAEHFANRFSCYFSCFTIYHIRHLKRRDDDGIEFASEKCDTFLWSSLCRCLTLRRIREIALSSREACFFLRFELEAASLSFTERRLSTICLHRRIIRPMSYWPTLPTPLMGEYQVKGVRTPGSMECPLGFRGVVSASRKPMKISFWKVLRANCHYCRKSFRDRNDKDELLCWFLYFDW